MKVVSPLLTVLAAMWPIPSDSAGAGCMFTARDPSPQFEQLRDCIASGELIGANVYGDELMRALAKTTRPVKLTRLTIRAQGSADFRGASQIGVGPIQMEKYCKPLQAPLHVEICRTDDEYRKRQAMNEFFAGQGFATRAIASDIVIEESTVEDGALRSQDLVFAGALTFRRVHFKRRLDLEKSIFVKPLELDEVTVDDGLLLKGNLFLADVRIRKATARFVSLGHNQFSSGLSITSLKADRLSSDETAFDGPANFCDIRIESMWFDLARVESGLRFRNSRVGPAKDGDPMLLFIRSFKGELDLTNTKVDGRAFIQHRAFEKATKHGFEAASVNVRSK